jgi:hypothetical protein
MLFIRISTKYVSHNFAVNQLDFSLDELIEIVCKTELCPKSAIKKITIKEIK